MLKRKKYWLGAAVAAERERRRYDSVVLKVLGASRRDILRAYAIEYGALGLAIAVLAALACSPSGISMTVSAYRAPSACSIGAARARRVSGANGFMGPDLAAPRAYCKISIRLSFMRG